MIVAASLPSGHVHTCAVEQADFWMCERSACKRHKREVFRVRRCPGADADVGEASGSKSDVQIRLGRKEQGDCQESDKMEGEGADTSRGRMSSQHFGADRVISQGTQVICSSCFRLCTYLHALEG